MLKIKALDWQQHQPHRDSLCCFWVGRPRQAVAGQKSPTDWRMSINCRYHVKEKLSSALHRDCVEACMSNVTDLFWFGCWLNFGFSISSIFHDRFLYVFFIPFSNTNHLKMTTIRLISYLFFYWVYFWMGLDRPSSWLGFNSFSKQEWKTVSILFFIILICCVHLWGWLTWTLQKSMHVPNSPDWPGIKENTFLFVHFWK